MKFVLFDFFSIACVSLSFISCIHVAHSNHINFENSIKSVKEYILLKKYAAYTCVSMKTVVIPVLNRVTVDV